MQEQLPREVFTAFMDERPGADFDMGIARMQRSGIRGWRGTELPELCYASSGLCCLSLPKVGSESGRMHQRET